MRRALENCVGRGKGNATNVPERELIDQVRIRPLLYDKNVKEYRKPGASDSAWSDVAEALGTSVVNCKKRWKSLRDTFIKYYRLEVLYNSGESRRKHKPWAFYPDLLFLKSHVEMFRLEESFKGGNELQNYVKECSDSGKVVFVEEFDDDSRIYKEEASLLEDAYEEPIEDALEEEYMLVEQEEIHDEKTIEKNPYEVFALVQDAEEEVEQPEDPPEVRPTETHQPTKEVPAAPSSTSPAKNIVDPDERYLMSCLPAFKRFTPQQKAYVRMGIERLFYEVEFENVSEPKSKKSRNS